MTNALSGVSQSRGAMPVTALDGEGDLDGDLRDALERRKQAGQPVGAQTGVDYFQSVNNAPYRNAVSVNNQSVGNNPNRRVGAAPTTDPPRQGYDQVRESAGPMYLTDIADPSVKIGDMSGAKFKEHFDKQTPENQQKVMSDYGLVRMPDGNLAVPTQAPAQSNVGNAIPGLGQAEGRIAQSASDNVDRSSYLMPGMAFAGAGLGGLVGMVVGAGALASVARGGLGSGIAAMGGTGGTIGNRVNVAKWGTYEAIGNAMGLDGLAHNARAIMQSHAREHQIRSMISMIDSGMPIEDLIFMFMAHLSELYEQRLREKMREQQVSEMLQEKRERRMAEAKLEGGLVSGGAAMTGGLISGLGGLLGPVGGAVAGGVGSAITAGGEQYARQRELQAMKHNEIDAKLNGNMKSGTILASEVQMLLHKWKAMQEMMTNLLKAMHDMQMSVIRNIR